MHCFLFQFTLILNSVLFWKLFIFKFLLSISESFLCSLSALLIKIDLTLDVLQLLMPFEGMLMDLEPKLFSFV
jgi:hypothetical protein